MFFSSTVHVDNGSKDVKSTQTASVVQDGCVALAIDSPGAQQFCPTVVQSATTTGAGGRTTTIKQEAPKATVMGMPA